MYNHIINMTFATSNNPTIRYFCTRKIGYIYIYMYIRYYRLYISLIYIMPIMCFI